MSVAWDGRSARNPTPSARAARRKQVRRVTLLAARGRRRDWPTDVGDANKAWRDRGTGSTTPAFATQSAGFVRPAGLYQHQTPSLTAHPPVSTVFSSACNSAKCESVPDLMLTRLLSTCDVSHLATHDVYTVHRDLLESAQLSASETIKRFTRRTRRAQTSVHVSVSKPLSNICRWYELEPDSNFVTTSDVVWDRRS